MTGANFDLTRIPKLQSAHVAIGGLAGFSASGSGTLDAPKVNAAIHLRDLALDQERAGDFTIQAVSQGSEIKITGQSQFDQAELKVDGNIQARGDWLADVYLRFQAVRCGFDIARST